VGTNLTEIDSVVTKENIAKRKSSKEKEKKGTGK
jgi:hypothetical protein